VLNYFTRKTKPAGSRFTGMGIEGSDISKLPAGFRTKDTLEDLYLGIKRGDAAGAKAYVKFYDRFTPTQIANFFLDNSYVDGLADKTTKEIPPGTTLDLNERDNGSPELAENVLIQLGFKVVA
jgi:hypothetical protein